MRAVVCQNAELSVTELGAPDPGPGQLRLEVLRCGICGSDLHARHGIDDWADMTAKAGYDRFGRSDQPVVFGHEFCGTVAEHGQKTRGSIPAGTPVVSLPLLRARDGSGVDTTGLSRHAPGAYAEQLLVEESLTLAVPNGLDPDIATLTEPMAVAYHAVRRGEVGRRQVAIVIGCGPVGLGVILMLKAQGVKTVVASDYSPGRRALAQRCGADVVVDPAQQEPFAARGADKHLNTIPETLELAVGATEKLSRLPGGPWRAFRLADRLGAEPKRPVVFECVGVPGMIQNLLDTAPMYTRTWWSACVWARIASPPRWRSTRRSTCAS
jgi:threonine dehydrogenase-like Zn-dependent dehydrogenase